MRYMKEGLTVVNHSDVAFQTTWFSWQMVYSQDFRDDFFRDLLHK